MALSHAAGSAVGRAYQRGDLFEKRRQLMEAWAAYLIAKQPSEDETPKSVVKPA